MVKPAHNFLWSSIATDILGQLKSWASGQCFDYRSPRNQEITPPNEVSSVTTKVHVLMI